MDAMDAIDEIRAAFIHARNTALKEGKDFQAWIAEIGILSIAGGSVRAPSAISATERLHFINDNDCDDDQTFN